MLKKIRLAYKCSKDSTVDGPGLRIVVWTQGCVHNCKECHNPETHDLKAGYLEDIDNVIDYINQAKMQRGITLSGGEPFLQPLELVPIAQAAKKRGMDVWSFSGYTYEQILKSPKKRKLLEELDVLVDGKFVIEEKDTRLRYKGSKNQRIIDVQQSLQEGRLVLSIYDESNQNI